MASGARVFLSGQPDVVGSSVWQGASTLPGAGGSVLLQRFGLPNGHVPVQARLGPAPSRSPEAVQMRLMAVWNGSTRKDHASRDRITGITVILQITRDPAVIHLVYRSNEGRPSSSTGRHLVFQSST